MADAAVEFLLGNLQRLPLYPTRTTSHTYSIELAKPQVEKLENDLRFFREFLRDSSKKKRKDDSFRELVRQIHDVVFEADDIIDAFVTMAADFKRNIFDMSDHGVSFRELPENLHGIARKVESISGVVKEIYYKNKLDLGSLNIGDGGPEELDKVSNIVSTYLNEDPERRMEKIIALSYDKLPCHLKACFLYLGMFPEDFEIPVWKLTRMWIAEGFIQQKDGISLEETAENYVDELINRNLVRVGKWRLDGRVKTCRIHDMLSDFCKNEAASEKERFFLEMEFKRPVAAIEKYRRICIHSNVLKLISLTPFGPHVRSFVCFSKEDTALPPEYTSLIPAACKLLRVLDVKPIKFVKLPGNMYLLVHLRYIAVSCNVAVLPASFGRLWNIETLIVDTSQRTLDIKADIWNMSQLRHLKTNASATLSKAAESGKDGEKLQTLGTISPQSCTDEILDRAHNLKTLGIRGKLASLLDGKTASFSSLVKLGSLEKLKLLNDVFPSPASEGQLRGLPPPYQFPRKLKSLTLSDTFLDWGHMSILGLLESLEVLKLKDKAFWGKFWETKDGGFRRLEVLHIGRTNLTFWVASNHHYPRLRRLELHNCEELKEIPIGLADIPSFRMLDLYRSNDAANSADKILKAKQMKWREQNITGGEFKLSIFPPAVQT